MKSTKLFESEVNLGELEQLTSQISDLGYRASREIEQIGEFQNKFESVKVSINITIEAK